MLEFCASTRPRMLAPLHRASVPARGDAERPFQSRFSLEGLVFFDRMGGFPYSSRLPTAGPVRGERPINPTAPGKCLGCANANLMASSGAANSKSSIDAE